MLARAPSWHVTVQHLTKDISETGQLNEGMNLVLTMLMLVIIFVECKTKYSFSVFHDVITF
jgi:hypothetical protein